ncbi:hypothetical protein Pmani_016030 [Petrolisthes manimaculis]|uniref:Protein NRDE2 homolog n=1 Tax=Petrolisthes manimaculis TaxID=1843537 RepID=A0AAE1PSI7_9EUCA|nr:hypothetical protein Pmani_016030 [Petrolisthes manimaculis]
MSLFPAYSVDKNEGGDSTASFDFVSSLNRQSAENEKDQEQRVELESIQQYPVENSIAESQLQSSYGLLVTEYDEQKGKDADQRKEDSSSDDTSSSSLPSPDKTLSTHNTNSPSTGNKAERDYSKSRSSSPSKKKKSKLKRKKKRSRSRNRSQSQKRSKLRKNRSRSRSSSRLKNKRSTSRLRRKKSRSRSTSRLRRKGSRSTSRSRRKKSRSRSTSRSRRKRSKSKRKKFRSRSTSASRRKRSRSGSTSRSRSTSKSRRKYSRSRSTSRSGRKRSGSKSRSRRNKSRSKSTSRSGRNNPRSKTKKTSQRSRSRSKSRGSKNSKLSQEHTRGKVEEYVSKSKSVFLEDLQGLVKPEQAFYISNDGDLNNKIFLTTHYSELTSYKIKAKGDLGNENSGRRSGTKSKKRTLRYFKRSALKVLYSGATKIRTLPKSPEDAETNDSSEYIPLDLTYAEEAKAKLPSQPSEVNPLGIYDTATECYLQGLESSKQEEPCQNIQDIEQEYWHNKSREYNERLGREPTNIPLWLEFVRFQDEVYFILFQDEDSDGQGTKKRPKKNQRALAERKISILDSAIKKNPRALEVNFERLEIGQDIWDDKKLKQEWDKLIFNFPNNISVWYNYLVFTQTHMTSFNLTWAVRMSSRCTERLRQMRNGKFLTHIPPANLGRYLVDVAVQLARVWQQGGHMERGVALFQALVELNIFLPNHVRSPDTTLEAKLALFEPFWDSRAPRFGEKSAVGWAKVMQRKEAIQYPEVILEGTRDEEDDILAQSGETSVLWLALETSRERRHWLPWEQDPEDCEDPERMVPLDELSSHLFELGSEEECYYLILQFLKFFDVPGVEDVCLRISRSMEEVSIFEPLALETFSNTLFFGNQLHNKTESKMQEILNFDTVGPSLHKPWCEEYFQFICQVLQQAAKIFSQPYRQNLTLLYIRLLGVQYHARKMEVIDDNNLKMLRKEIKKNIKSILKLEEYRMCLPIYQEYGKVEEVMGFMDDAANVYITALSVGTATGNAFDVASKDFLALNNLFDSYIQIQIQREIDSRNGEHINNLLYSLCSLITSGKFTISNGSPTPGGFLLKARKKLIELQEFYNTSLTTECNTSEKDDNIGLLNVRIVSFMALIQLFTVGFKPACLVYETSIAKAKNGNMNKQPCKLKDIALPSEKVSTIQGNHEQNHENNDEVRCGILEQLYEGYIWLVDTSKQLEHLVSGHMSPLAYREIVMAATTIAPLNYKFLLHLAQNQSWRNFVGGKNTTENGSKSIVVLISHILPHLQRTLKVLTSTEEGSLSCGHRLESVLDKAVSTSPGKHCPLLWRLYMALVAVTRPTRLKGLAYRALAHCPGVKSVYLDCVRRVPKLLKDGVSLMTEKGLRTRLPLEELQVLMETELELECDTEGDHSDITDDIIKEEESMEDDDDLL